MSQNNSKKPAYGRRQQSRFAKRLKSSNPNEPERTQEPPNPFKIQEPCALPSSSIIGSFHTKGRVAVPLHGRPYTPMVAKSPYYRETQFSDSVNPIYFHSISRTPADLQRPLSLLPSQIYPKGLRIENRLLTGDYSDSANNKHTYFKLIITIPKSDSGCTTARRILSEAIDELHKMSKDPTIGQTRLTDQITPLSRDSILDFGSTPFENLKALAKELEESPPGFIFRTE